QGPLRALRFKLYEVERPGGGRQVDRPGGRAAGPTLPLWHRLFAAFPGAARARTDFDAFGKVEQQVFLREYLGSPGISAAFGTPEEYRRSMQDALGLIALLTLHSTRDDSGRIEGLGGRPPQWAVSPVYASILDILRRTRG